MRISLTVDFLILIFHLFSLLFMFCWFVQVSFKSEVSFNWFNRLKSSNKEFEFCTRDHFKVKILKAKICPFFIPV